MHIRESPIKSILGLHTAICSLLELAIWVCEGNVADGKPLFLCECPVRFHHELVEELVVSVVVSDGHYDHTAWFQLVNERLRNSRSNRTGMDDVVGSSILLAFPPVTTENLDASVLELLAVTLC